MTIKDLMSSPVKTCRTTALMGQAARIMLDEGYGCLPVVDSRRRLAGMITDRDVCLAVAARRQSPWEIPVREVMSSNLVSCMITDDVNAALVAMKEYRVRRVPVVDEAGRVKGLISIDDVILKSGGSTGPLAAEAVLDVLRHLCASREPELAGVR